MMEKTRTLYRLRNYKNSVMINLFLIVLGVLVFSFLQIFENEILYYFKDKNINIVQTSYNQGIQQSLFLSNMAFNLLEKAAIIVMILSLEGFLIIFFFIRMPLKQKSIFTKSSFILGLGTLLIFLFYMIIGLSISGNTNYAELNYKFQYLKIFGFLLIIFANILFAIQLFIQIILEKSVE